MLFGSREASGSNEDEFESLVELRGEGGNRTVYRLKVRVGYAEKIMV